jgi:8-oxo-dGTP diphosphatase
VLGVGAFVFDRRGRVLLVRRGAPPARGAWSVPGGRVEPGERTRTACRREVYEETGVQIRPGPLVAWFEAIGAQHHYVVLDFLALHDRRGPTRLRPGDDANGARWAGRRTLAALPTTPRLAHYVRRAWRRAQAMGFFDASPGTSRTRRGTR